MATGVRVLARRRFSQFLITQPPDVEVDGVLVGQGGWKGDAALFETSPGQHTVTVSFVYLKRRSGVATIDVDVAPGEVVELLYRTPFAVPSAGSLRRA